MTYTVAFVGNPNVGKSAWINALSNANFKVGNWPGVTVEKKEAYVEWEGKAIHMIDLPGTHSLESSQNEENITGDFLCKEHVDLIVNVVDATNLRNNLLLTLLLRELQIPMILLFNFMDEVEKFHIYFDTLKLSRRLQIEILPYSALDATHHIQVKRAIQQHLGLTKIFYPLLSQEREESYVNLYNYVDDHLPTNVSIDEQTLHILMMRYMKRDIPCSRQFCAWNLDMEQLEQLRGDVDDQQIMLEYQEVIDSLMKYVKEDVHRRYETTTKMDYLALHKYWGLPIFFFIFTCMLLFVFQFSAPWNDYIDYLVHDVVAPYLAYSLSWTPLILQRLILDGMLAGVGGVLVFVPVMACLHFMMAILEESGYMARISFLLDRCMRVFHLSGKSFVALLLGFGCNVPAIYATRTLDNEKQRRLTAILIPFMSCGARLPVYVLFASAFFPHQAGFMIITVYGIGLFMALVFALLFSKLSFMKDQTMYIQELPVYRKPSLRIVFHKVKEEVQSYMKKATGIVLWAMVILWSLSYFPNAQLKDSYIACASRFVQPIFEPLGFGNRWESIASLPGGIIAKETIVGYYDQVLHQQENHEPATIHPKQDVQQIAKKFVQAVEKSISAVLHPHVDLKAKTNKQVEQIHQLWQDSYAKLRAFSFMIYVLLSIPCVMTLQALYHEYGWKLMSLSIIVMMVIPYIVSLIIFQLFSHL